MLHPEGQEQLYGYPQPASGAQAPQLEPVLNWTKLARNDDLELVRRNGKKLASGSVDMLALDGSVFWLIQDNGHGRAMFLPEDDVIVFRRKRPRKAGDTTSG